MNSTLLRNIFPEIILFSGMAIVIGLIFWILVFPTSFSDFTGIKSETVPNPYYVIKNEMNSWSCDELKNYVIRYYEGDKKVYMDLAMKAEKLYEWKCEK